VVIGVIFAKRMHFPYTIGLISEEVGKKIIKEIDSLLDELK